MDSPLLKLLGRLRCPFCRGAFSSGGAVLTCAAGHTFDIAREGYVNLTSAPASRLASDTKPMVDARRRILDSGLYDRIAHRLEPAARSVASDRARDLVDLGCGPGYYLGQMISDLGDVRAVGVDLSKDAIRAAARSVPSAAFVVGDVGTEIPVADDAFDLGISVFAPRAVTEWKRLLRPGGTMIVVMAGPRHLTQLIDRYDLLKVGADKHERLLDQLRHERFTIDDVARITYDEGATAEQVLDLILMGPNYWHVARDETLETEAMDLAVDVVLTVATLRT